MAMLNNQRVYDMLYVIAPITRGFSLSHLMWPTTKGTQRICRSQRHFFDHHAVFCQVDQWEFQDPKMEVPTIYKAYIRPTFQGISPQNIANNMVLTYLHFRILEISHWVD